MHARARPRRTRNACAAGVQKWRFAGVETARPCPPESLRASLPVPWSLSTLPASIRRSQRLLRSFWQTGDRDFCQPTSALSRPTKHLRAIARVQPAATEGHASIQPNSWRWSRSAGRPARLACSSCCRRRCTSIYTVSTLDSCCITPFPKTLSKSRCLTHPFCSSRRKTVRPPHLVAMWPRPARAREHAVNSNTGRPARGFEMKLIF